MLMPLAAQLVTSRKLRQFRRGWFEIKRRLVPSLNTVIFYHRVNDPYSYLLLQAMPRFLEDFRVRLQFRFVLDLPELGGRRRLEGAGCPTFAVMEFAGH